MANRLVKMQTDLSHYNEYNDGDARSINPEPPKEADKTKSISEMTQREVYQLLERLRSEKDAEQLIRDLRRSAGLGDTYENPAKIDTATPIDQLYHHGILGQKWGVRRYQRTDGSRTPAGKKREAEQQDYEKSEDYRTSRENKKKSPEGLSNEELRKLNERLQLETTYKNLTTEKIQKSESFVAKALRDAGSQALTEFSKGVFLGSAKLLVKEVSPDFAETAFGMKQEKKKS